ncbi:N-acetylmuramoyl-L-alanine amidase [Streptomyces sp. TR02-1]|uniref:N-acetylmuramoyl-L-alanine amidase n=1 Tax=Streptomyces sp. TR02-1 TaxID=3385977 RepID=UPI0039A341B3
MTRSGPQKYPGASTAHWYQDDWGGDAMESNVGVLHTTEGTSLPSYRGGASAPNFTAVPDLGGRLLRWYQHFDFDTSSRALVNQPGGVETNTLNAVQVELVGTCDPARRSSWGDLRAGRDYLYWPEAPEWALAALAEFVRWAHDAHDVPLRSTVTWKAYPGSYGAANGVRLTGSQWLAYYGWLGHSHVPENLHGDPGALDVARVLAYARGDAQEDDVPEYLSLGLAAGPVLRPGAWTPLTWDREFADPLDEHAATGQTFVTGPGRFTGTAYLRVNGLSPGATLQARLVEVEGGRTVTHHPIGEGVGSAGSTFYAFPLTGHVASGRRMKVQVTHFGEDEVTLDGSYLKALVWDR